MNRTFLLAVMASTLSFAVQAQTTPTLTIIESGESLSATYDGASFGTITPNGNLGDNWDFTLPQGYTFNNVGGTFFVPEPPGEGGNIGPFVVPVSPLVNVVTIRDATTLNWVSEFPLLGTDSLQALELVNERNGVRITSGGMNPSGAPFDLLLLDVGAGPGTGAPDAGSTLALSAIGFGLIAAARRKMKS